MATMQELARSYASRLGRAKRSLTESRIKIATQGDVFRLELEEILREVGSLTHTESGASLSTFEEKRLLELLDDSLRVQRGTMQQIKEGSVQMSIEYQALVMQLLDDVEYE